MRPAGPSRCAARRIERSFATSADLQLRLRKYSPFQRFPLPRARIRRGRDRLPRTHRPAGPATERTRDHEHSVPQAAARHPDRLFRRPRGGRGDPARRLRRSALCLARARRTARPPLRSRAADRRADPDHRAQARSRFPVVSGPGRLPRHPRPDRAGRSCRPTRRHRRPGRRSGQGQSGRADPAHRRSQPGGRIRRLRSGSLRQEPRGRGPPQRGPLPLHRMDQASLRERRRDPRRQRHHAPDQPGEDVAGDPGPRRHRLPRHLRRHRQPHPARRRAGRDRRGRRRAGGGDRHARPPLDDAPARHRRGPADRAPCPRHHRHRHRARPDRVPAQRTRRRSLAGILRGRRGQPLDRRPRNDLQHVPGIRGDGGDVPYRPTDHRLPDADRARRGAGGLGQALRADHRPLGRCAEDRRIRARAGVRPVERGPQHGRPLQPAPAPADLGAGGTRHRRGARPGARRGARGAVARR